MKIFFFLLGIFILVCAEVARVYFIMPFPGSQEDNVIDLAYFLNNYIHLFRIAGILLIAYPAYALIRFGVPAIRWTVVTVLVFWLFVFYNSNFRLMADKMFYQPEHKILSSASQNKVDKRALVLGVNINNEAKAYPIEIIGYHHQVRDTIGGEAVMVTYCTVCRTGRVFSPMVDGQPEEFRLVGMDHFNAMFEDSRTKSWWRQVSGEAITGPLKGKQLREIPSEQMTLQAWLSRYPNSYVLQPDSLFKEQYAELARYDEGKTEVELERTDSLSWNDRSWVVGVSLGLFARAYDWNDLVRARVINDEIEQIPIAVVLENDSASFHVWSRIVSNDTLVFAYSDSLKTLIDTNTNSVWDWSGRCTEGIWKGTSLNRIQSYQEFWHSWRTFHPNTDQYLPNLKSNE
jgi:hypothetical protein